MIRAWHAMGKSNCWMADQLRVSRSTVAFQLAQDRAPSFRDRPVPPPLSTAAQLAITRRRAMVRKLITEKVVRQRTLKRARSSVARTVVLFPNGSPALVARRLAISGFDRCSCTTVRRDVRAIGLVCRVRPWVPRHSVASLSVRLAFAKRLLRLSAAYRDKILFSDEKWFDTNDHGGRFQYVERGSDDEVEPRTTELFPRKVIVWGCIGIGFKLLIVLRGEQLPKFGPGRPRKGEARPPKQTKQFTVNAQVYTTKCLAKLVQTATQRGRATDSWVLMQDGAACHTAALTTQWMQEHCVAALENWPPHSPDLNPIELVWSTVSERVSKRGPVSEDDLIRFVQAEWNRLSQDDVDAFVRCFTDRLRRCVATGGAVVV